MIENVKKRKGRAPGGADLGSQQVGEDVDAQETQEHPLDSEESKEILKRLESWWLETRAAHSENRREMALDEAFRDHEQWTPEDIADLNERGQAALQFNMILPLVLWISGTERKTRVDTRVLPRGEEDTEGAEAKTKLLKYLSDVNKTPYARSEAVLDSATVGVGWLETGVCDSEDEEPLYEGYESWRNVWPDHHCREKDVSKHGRYLFRVKTVDLDDAIALFPDRAAELKAAAERNNLFDTLDYDLLGTQDLESGEFIFEEGYSALADGDYRRPRVRLIECWYRMPARSMPVLTGTSPAMKRSPYHNTIYNEADDVHRWTVETQRCSLVNKPRRAVRCAIFIPGTLLMDCPSPYWHNRFPFVAIWCYRRGKDGMPFGVVRGNRGIQEDLNKRRSKALHVLSNNQIIMEKGAVDDVEELRDEADRPDGIIVHKKNFKLELSQDKSLAQEHVNLMLEDKEMIQESGGITSENLGRESNATSGKAIIARQQQGHTVTAPIFDNIRFAIQISGELKLANIEQFFDEARTVRIVGERGKIEWLKINEPGAGSIITESQADFIVDEEDFNATIRQAMFESMYEMTAKLPPEISLKLLDLVFEFSDLPGREEIVRRIRKINGMDDPNSKKTPEEEAAEQAAVTEEAEINRRRILAELEKLEGQAKEAKAKGDKTMLEAINSKLRSMNDSIGLASTLAAVPPQISAAADAIMDDARTGN